MGEPNLLEVGFGIVVQLREEFILLLERLLRTKRHESQHSNTSGSNSYRSQFLCELGQVLGILKKALINQGSLSHLESGAIAGEWSCYT